VKRRKGHSKTSNAFRSKFHDPYCYPTAAVLYKFLNKQITDLSLGQSLKQGAWYFSIKSQHDVGDGALQLPDIFCRKSLRYKHADELKSKTDQKGTNQSDTKQPAERIPQLQDEDSVKRKHSPPKELLGVE